MEAYAAPEYEPWLLKGIHALDIFRMRIGLEETLHNTFGGIGNSIELSASCLRLSGCRSGVRA
jgi:hypothetical protein